jgi:hypothetical protein
MEKVKVEEVAMDSTLVEAKKRSGRASIDCGGGSGERARPSQVGGGAGRLSGEEGRNGTQHPHAEETARIDKSNDSTLLTSAI